MWAMNKIRAPRMFVLTLNLRRPDTDLQLFSRCNFCSLNLLLKFFDAAVLFGCQLLAMVVGIGLESESGTV